MPGKECARTRAGVSKTPGPLFGVNSSLWVPEAPSFMNGDDWATFSSFSFGDGGDTGKAVFI